MNGSKKGAGLILRRVGAGFGGLLVGVVLSIGTDLVMHAVGVFPPWGQAMSNGLFILATAYRLVYCVLGSYLAARFAPDKPMAHALTLGVLGIFANAAGTIATWNKGPEFGPHWYPLLLLATSLPCAWLGGKLFLRRSSH